VPVACRAKYELALLAAFLAAGIYLRSVDIADRPLAVDEAESAINALTILEHGVPTSSYMGLPIYENTLTTPWPESREYEFRDSSYSERGLAIYHAWLPLYAIAAALGLAGITPDPPTAELKSRHPPEDLRFRTLVPRLPSLLFATIFMLAMYGLGRAVGGDAGAWTALLLAACTGVVVELGTAARYYSATMAFSALGGWTLWRLAERGRLRDYLAHGATMTLLFHSHLLSCLVLGLVTCGFFPVLVRQRQFLRGACACGGVFLLGVLPWVLATGFPGQAAAIPKAWEVMELPGDLLRLSGQRTLQVAALGAAAIWVLCAVLAPRALPAGLVRPILAHRRALLFFLGWLLAAFLGFSFLIPLISYFPERMSMMLAVPKLMFITMMIVTTLRSWSRWRPIWTAPAAALLLLLATGRAAGASTDHDFDRSATPWLAEYFTSREFAPGARLYTEPNQQLILAYLLGLPAQSIAPVRKEFLDQHAGEIVLIAHPPFAMEWDAARVRAVLAAADAAAASALDAAAAEAIAQEVHVADARAAVFAAGATPLGPPALPLPAPIIAERARERALATTGWWTNVPAFRGFEVRDHDFAWKVFFYRFVDPVARSGAGAVYADRLRGASAELLPAASCVVYRSPLQRAQPPSR
jgi:hypothetical protein